MRVYRCVWVCVSVLLLQMAAGSMALAADAEQNSSATVTTAAPTGADEVIYYATGINPQDYPCARSGMLALYEKRTAISDLSRFHPKRVFTWVAETSVYYTYRFIDFLKGLMNPNVITDGIRRIQAMASQQNPLQGLDNTVNRWLDKLNPRSQFVLKRKMFNIIENTTNEDGSCKIGG